MKINFNLLSYNENEKAFVVLSTPHAPSTGNALSTPCSQQAIVHDDDTGRYFLGAARADAARATPAADGGDTVDV